MSTEPQHTCPSCGNEFSGAMEFCPVCMLRQALAGGGSGESSAFEDTIKPAAGQAAQRFEHYELVKRVKTGNRSNWVAVRWASLTKRSTSTCTAP
jgi:predicted amidophosphoribosyltransferase